MKSRIRRVKKYRRYSKEFKQSIVDHFEQGKFSVKELSLHNSISQQLIYKWIYQLSRFNKKGYRIVEKTNSQAEKLKQLQKENQALKATVGEKQIHIEYLERLIEIAEVELDVDIKKNSSTSQLNTSDKIKKS